MCVFVCMFVFVVMCVYVFVLKTYTCEDSVKDFFVQNSLLEDVPPPMRGKMWIPRMVGQCMVGRPDPRITIR